MPKSELASLGFDDQEIRVLEQKMGSWDYSKFPGSQPVSFAQTHMYRLQQSETIVCEKSDGVRYLLCEISNKNQTAWVLIDRGYKFRQIVPSFDMIEVNSDF
jgi:hypothetical protein